MLADRRLAKAENKKKSMIEAQRLHIEDVSDIEKVDNQDVMEHKLKKTDSDAAQSGRTIELTTNPDILAEVASLPAAPYCVGFAAESQNLDDYAEAKRRGLFGDGNRGLGVVIFDFDQDGDADIYVANDMTANFLFVNDGTGMFKESGMQLGCAVDRNGSPQASMGLACGDYDGDGWLDLYSTHFQFDSNTLYRNLGAGPAGFQDVKIGRAHV